MIGVNLLEERNGNAASGDILKNVSDAIQGIFEYI